MSRDIWFTSDLHFGTEGSLKWLDGMGNPIRDFPDQETFEQTVIDNHNQLVNPHDKVYFLGDVVMHERGLEAVKKMNGVKYLVGGNHDRLKAQKYLTVFNDVMGCRWFGTHRFMLTHIPVYIDPYFKLRKKLNVHGHLHVQPSPTPYHYSVCLEVNDYKPTPISKIMEYYGELYSGK